MRVITLEEHMSTERFLAATSPSQEQNRGPLADYWNRMNAALLNVGGERIAAMDARVSMCRSYR